MQVSDIVKFADCKPQLTTCRESLAKINISREIFQGDSLLPLLFVICMIPLTHILCKAKARHTLEWGDKINHLLFMGNLKLYGKIDSEIKGLVSFVEVFSLGIGMKFDIEKCSMNITKGEKVKSTGGIQLPSSENIRKIEEDRYKYLGILEYCRIKGQEMIDMSGMSISGGQNWFWILNWMEGIG